MPNLKDRSTKFRGHRIKLILLSNAKRFPAVTFFVVATHCVYGGSLDSVKLNLQNSPAKAQFEVLYSKGYELIDLDDQLSLSYMKEAYEVAIAAGDTVGIVKSGHYNSFLLRRQGNIDSSLIISLRVLPLARAKKMDDEIPKILNTLILINVHKSFFDKALKYGLECLAIRRNHGSVLEFGAALNNVGLVYFKLENYDKALPYFLESLANMKKSETKYGLNRVLSNISVCYAYKRNLKAARHFLTQSIQSDPDSCLNESVIRTKFASGLISFIAHDYKSAESDFLQSFALANKESDEMFKIDNAVYLCRIYFKRGNITSVQKLIASSGIFSSARLTYNSGLTELYSELIKYYEMSGDPVNVQLYQKKYIGLKDTINSNALTKNLITLEVEQAEAENKAKLQAQDQILELNAELISKQHTQNISFITMIALLLLLIVLLVRSNKIKKVTNLFLEQRVKERTLELEISHGNTMRSLVERSHQMESVSNEVRKSLATIRGLCILVQNDADKTQIDICVSKIESTIENLHGVLNRQAKVFLSSVGK